MPRIHAKIPGMGEAEPDINELFAPLVPAQAFGVVLSEARDVLGHLREPLTRNCGVPT